MIKLSKTDTMKNKRRDINLKIERDHVNSTIIVSEDLVVRDVATHFSSEGARLQVEEFSKRKITTLCLLLVFSIPKVN